MLSMIEIVFDDIEIKIDDYINAVLLETKEVKIKYKVGNDLILGHNDIVIRG